jgi:hypothetical protein
MILLLPRITNTETINNLRKYISQDDEDEDEDEDEYDDEDEEDYGAYEAEQLGMVFCRDCGGYHAANHEEEEDSDEKDSESILDLELMEDEMPALELVTEEWPLFSHQFGTTSVRFLGRDEDGLPPLIFPSDTSRQQEKEEDEDEDALPGLEGVPPDGLRSPVEHVEDLPGLIRPTALPKGQ